MSVFSAVGKKLAESAQSRLKAYHGSPHDFDRFSTDNIGTGEGAQAYGHGLYFAEREGTAMSYRDALTPRDFDYEEHLMEQYKVAESMEDYNRMDMLERAMQHDTPADFRDIASDADYDDDYRQLAADMADEMEGFVSPNGNPVNFGRMYEVDIDASPDELLDYDVDLIDQSQKVKDGILKLGLTDLNGKKYSIQELDDLGHRGQTLYEKISANAGDDVASMRLKDVGIKGIKYADAQTRFSPKGRTNNYVMFDDKTVEIARKYGVSMPVAGAILAGTITPEDAQAGALASGGASADQAREQQRFESLEAEEQKLRAMGSASFGKVSSELAAYRRSQLLPDIGTLAQGAVRDTAKGLDYLSPANLTRLLFDPADEGLSRFMAKPISNKISKGAEVLTRPMLYDENDPYSKKRKQDGMDLGGTLFSPL